MAVIVAHRGVFVTSPSPHGPGRADVGQLYPVGGGDGESPRDENEHLIAGLPGLAEDLADLDGMVDFNDFFLLAAAFGTSKGGSNFDPMFDLDGSGSVDFGDFFIFVANFGKATQ